MIRFQRLLNRIIGYPKPTFEFEGKMFEVNNWIVSDFILDRIIPVVGVHPYPLGELAILVSTVCWFEPDFIYEWGTHEGKSARIFWETVRTFKLKSKIVTVDLPPSAIHNELPSSDQYAKYIKSIKDITKIRGDGLTASLKLCTKHPKNSRVLFFLDGDHSRATVYNELREIFKKVKKPCVIVHDTFYQSDESKYNVGPHEAVKQILRELKNLKIISENNLGLPGMTVLIKTE